MRLASEASQPERNERVCFNSSLGRSTIIGCATRNAELSVCVVDHDKAVRRNTQLLSKPGSNHHYKVIAFYLTYAARERREFVPAFREWNTECELAVLELGRVPRWKRYQPLNVEKRAVGLTQQLSCERINWKRRRQPARHIHKGSSAPAYVRSEPSRFISALSRPSACRRGRQ